MKEEKFNIEIDREEIIDLIKTTVKDRLIKQLKLQTENIDKSISEYFNRSFFHDKKNDFENALDWAVEDAFRLGISEVMQELDFKSIIADKARELLKDDTLIHDLAEAKVRSSLGLNLKH